MAGWSRRAEHDERLGTDALAPHVERQRQRHIHATSSSPLCRSSSRSRRSMRTAAMSMLGASRRARRSSAGRKENSWASRTAIVKVRSLAAADRTGPRAASSVRERRASGRSSLPARAPCGVGTIALPWRSNSGSSSSSRSRASAWLTAGCDRCRRLLAGVMPPSR